MDFIKNVYVSLFGFSPKEWNIGLVVGAVGGVISGMVGGYDGFMQAMTVVMTFDIFTGFYCSIILKQTGSTKGLAGLHKKVGILVMVGLASVVDNSLGQTGVLRNGAIIFYTAMEGLSCIENLTAMGVPQFQPLREYLIQLKEGNKKGPSKLIELDIQPTQPTEKTEG